MTDRVAAAIIGPGNIGTDLLMKLTRSDRLSLELMAGIDPASPGLQRAAARGIATSPDGVDAVLAREDIAIVFDATSAKAHHANARALERAGKVVVDLTPAARGPYVVPAVNLDEHLGERNVNLITCGGQATIPMVHAVARAATATYAEIVATIASASAGPGTRQNIDEFTQTTARAVEIVGGVPEAKAIIILNPASPPMLMRDTVFVRIADGDPASIERSVREMAEVMRSYVPGYRLVLCEVVDDVVTVMVEIEGAGDFLPTYAGNLDIMTAAAAQVGEQLAARILAEVAA